jgi:hypothetical protein
MIDARSVFVPSATSFIVASVRVCHPVHYALGMGARLREVMTERPRLSSLGRRP